MISMRTAAKDPLFWLAFLGLAVGACAPALGTLLDGGEEDLLFEDDEQGVTVEVDANGCEKDDDGKVCDYDLVVSGLSSSEQTFEVTLWYGPDGEVEAREGYDDTRGREFDGHAVLMLKDAKEGDDDHVIEGSNRYTVELAGTGEDAEDADGEEHHGCDQWRYTFEDRSDTVVDAYVCPDIGLTRVDVRTWARFSLGRKL